MKKLTKLLMLFFAVAVFTVSCNDDDSSEGKTEMTDNAGNRGNSGSGTCASNIQQLNSEYLSALTAYNKNPTDKDATCKLVTASQTYWEAFKNCPGFTQEAYDAQQKSIAQWKAFAGCK